MIPSKLTPIRFHSGGKAKQSSDLDSGSEIDSESESETERALTKPLLLQLLLRTKRPSEETSTGQGG